MDTYIYCDLDLATNQTFEKDIIRKLIYWLASKEKTTSFGEEEKG